MEISKDLQLAINAAKKAGVLVRNGFGNVNEVSIKQNVNDVVTDIDKKSERLIIEELNVSGYSILAEETGSLKNDSDFVWVIDPLDGTKNFSASIPLFCISIALMKGSRVLLGVVFNPFSDELFYAEKGKGAFLNGKKISVSDCNFSTGCIIFVNSGWKQQSRSDFIEASSRLRNSCSLRYFGSTALELCYVAAGRGDAFLSSGDSLWDYAAGILIVEEAGGIVTDWKGNAWSEFLNFIFASNKSINNEIREKIKGIQ